MPELISCTVLPQGNLTSWHQNSLTNYHIIVKIMNKSWNYSIYDTCIMCFLNLFHRYSIIIAIVSLTFCCPNYSEHTITQSKYKYMCTKRKGESILTILVEAPHASWSCHANAIIREGILVLSVAAQVCNSVLNIYWTTNFVWANDIHAVGEKVS